MTAYYNEIDPYAVQWLKNLIDAGHIAPGDVDNRSIEDVTPSDLRGYTQCHFFAGIGIWSYALRQAGWKDDRQVWTGSCPCQPFSAAGKGEGVADERHLWPAFFHLIQQCRPDVVFGEQVASTDGLGWLDIVQADLEGAGYSATAIDLCAAGIGAPHIRQRLYWVADAIGERWEGRQSGGEYSDTSGWRAEGGQVGILRKVGGLSNAVSQRSKVRISKESAREKGESGKFNDSHDQLNGRAAAFASSPTNPTNGFWRDADWLSGRDGKWRSVEPGTFPLVDGFTGRVGRVRAYGNAINAEVAKTFIASYLDVIDGLPE